MNLALIPKILQTTQTTFFLNNASNLVEKLPPASNSFSTNTEIFREYYHNKNVLPNSFMLNLITDNFVNRELSCLDPNKSCGIDGIQANF